MNRLLNCSWRLSYNWLIQSLCLWQAVLGCWLENSSCCRNVRFSGFTTCNLRKWRTFVEKSSSGRWFLVYRGGNTVYYACVAGLGCGITSWGPSYRIFVVAVVVVRNLRNLRKITRNLYEKSSLGRWYLVDLGGNDVLYACGAWLGCIFDPRGPFCCSGFQGT